MNKIYIKSLKNGKYLNPVYSNDRWVSFDDATFFEVENLDSVVISDLVDLYLIQDYDAIMTYYNNDDVEITVDNNVLDIFTKNEYIDLRDRFNSSKIKSMEHYIIFNFIKNKDLYYGISIGKRNKFELFFRKINLFIKMIDNVDISIKYLKLPFPTIKNSDFKKILNKIKIKLEN
jgi:hypothetical protein